MKSTKDPSEIITVTFDFTDIADAIANPLVSCIVIQGQVDTGLVAMLAGNPQVIGKTVRQRVIGGIDGNTYRLRCAVDDSDGERWVIADNLIVEAV